MPAAAATATDNSTSVTARPDGLVDPVPGYAYQVLLDNVLQAAFTSVSGLSVTRDVELLREGGLNDGVHWLHSGFSFGKITLERGIAHSHGLWDWFVIGAEDANVAKKSVVIEQLVPYTQKVARRYELEGAIATSWTGPRLAAGGTDVAVETLEIAFSRFTMLIP